MIVELQYIKLWDAANTVLSGKFKTLNSYIRNKERLKNQ